MARTRSQSARGLGLLAPDRAVAEISRAALIGNFRAIRKIVPKQDLIPMVKADAYGHGSVWVANAIAGETGLRAFGVATLVEGAELRAGLRAAAPAVDIIVFSDVMPFTEIVGQFCERHRLTPVLSAASDLSRF